jgi:hypothetical protein
MQRLIALVVGTLLSSAAFAATTKIDSTIYGTTTKEPTEIKLPNGSTVFAGFESTGRIVGKDGQESMQYCHGDGLQEKDATQISVGFCAVVFDNSDVLWVWFRNDGPGTPGTWGVIGGTGEYAGATGGGTNAGVSQRGDGRSGTSTSVGKIKTK